MDICHAAGPISPIVSVALQGFCIEILYMPSNTDLSPLSDLQAWPLSKAYPEGSVTQPLSLSSGWENVVVGEKAWKCQSQTMDGTDAGFMAPKCDRWRTTLPALTHGTLPLMLVCSKNILIVLLIRILQADLKLLEIYLLMGLSDSYSKKKKHKKESAAYQYQHISGPSLYFSAGSSADIWPAVDACEQETVCARKRKH